MIFIGLMSGTSLDGIDAVVVDLDGDHPSSLACATLAFRTTPWTSAQRERLAGALESGGPPELCRLHADIGEAFAAAARAAMEAAGVSAGDVRAIGSHGQTVWHEPPAGSRRGATLQLGDPATIAERTGVDVIADFRTRDVAAGGHGAPLVCFADRVLFPTRDRGRAIQNLGGMGNVTWIPPRGEGTELLAFDTGPANALIDIAVEMATNGARTYDANGEWAAAGTVDEARLLECLAHPFFASPPPRSTGREVFGRSWVRRLVEEWRPGSESEWKDVVATLTAFTARSIGDAYRAWVLPRGVEDVVLVGGGAHNDTLRRMIGDELGGIPVRRAVDTGVDADAREAIGFAILAWAFVHRIPGNEVGATGAHGPRVLGSLTPGEPAGFPPSREIG